SLNKSIESVPRVFLRNVSATAASKNKQTLELKYIEINRSYQDTCKKKYVGCMNAFRSKLNATYFKIRKRCVQPQCSSKMLFICEVVLMVSLIKVERSKRSISLDTRIRQRSNTHRRMDH
ncbi:hypothetical protein C0J52_26952, partial [Blattella germanica]